MDKEHLDALKKELDEIRLNDPIVHAAFCLHRAGNCTKEEAMMIAIVQLAKFSKFVSDLNIKEFTMSRFPAMNITMLPSATVEPAHSATGS